MRSGVRSTSHGVLKGRRAAPGSRSITGSTSSAGARWRSSRAALGPARPADDDHALRTGRTGRRRGPCHAGQYGPAKAGATDQAQQFAAFHLPATVSQYWMRVVISATGAP